MKSYSIFFRNLFLLLRILYERPNHIDSGVHLHLHSILLYNYATIYEFSVDGHGGWAYKTKNYAMNMAAHVSHYTWSKTACRYVHIVPPPPPAPLHPILPKSGTAQFGAYANTSIPHILQSVVHEIL